MPFWWPFLIITIRNRCCQIAWGPSGWCGFTSGWVKLNYNWFCFNITYCRSSATVDRAIPNPVRFWWLYSIVIVIANRHRQPLSQLPRRMYKVFKWFFKGWLLFFLYLDLNLPKSFLRGNFLRLCYCAAFRGGGRIRRWLLLCKEPS